MSRVIASMRRLYLRVTSVMNGLHQHEPAEGEQRVALPNARHTLEMSGNESG
jgi:hypothetical protein